ncbi:hypothetical protein TRAPUB_10523 [Trametes pubescens]|uniref:Transcription factor tau 55 kDa subunit n=1 Tax=Trametes pubescens TaxID=154538 RepID=A0A1M2VZF0_TRAPU|nr:hypothetical protein TRAPUB_10523 [Trametes pubescens]
MNWVTDDWESITGLARDPPLAPFGLTQAEELADYFLSLPEHERPTIILSSPYYRCLQTAVPSAQKLQLPLYVEHGLAEWYSPVAPDTGLHPRPSSATDLRGYFPEIDDSWKSIYYVSRKGEDLIAVHDRTKGLMRALVPYIERKFGGQHKRVLLVSHAATVIALTRELLADREMPLKVGCCTVTELARKPGETEVLGGWDVKRLADGSHLKEGVQREWGFENAIIRDGKVINDSGQPGTEHEKDEPVGLQADLLS